MWVPGVCITRLDADTAEADLFDQALHELIAQAASNSHNSGHGNGSSSSSSSSSPKARPYTHVAFTSKNGIHATIQRLADLTGKTTTLQMGVSTLPAAALACLACLADALWSGV